MRLLDDKGSFASRQPLRKAGACCCSCIASMRARGHTLESVMEVAKR